MVNIYNIAILNEVKNIFEVGTWNGQGSTVCIMNAIINKENSRLYSLEANINMYNLSKEFWHRYNTKNKLSLIYGSLHKKIADEVNVNIDWYIGEKNTILNTNIVDINDIYDIDFIILDGGEYTTQEDFNILIKKNPKYIALDDVNVFKCKNIREYLINSNDWILLNENLEERNGWSIFKCKNV